MKPAFSQFEVKIPTRLLNLLSCLLMTWLAHTPPVERRVLSCWPTLSRTFLAPDVSGDLEDDVAHVAIFGIHRNGDAKLCPGLPRRVSHVRSHL